MFFCFGVLSEEVVDSASADPRSAPLQLEGAKRRTQDVGVKAGGQKGSLGVIPESGAPVVCTSALTRKLGVPGAWRLQVLATCHPDLRVLLLPKSVSSWLVWGCTGLGCVALCFLGGGGIVFLKATSYVCPVCSLVPF